MGATSRVAKAAAALALAAAAHVGAMAWANAPARPADAGAAVASLSFSPNQRHANPERGDAATPDEIARDLDVVRRITRKVRTYTVGQNLDAVPALADRRGMRVALGVWVDNRDPGRTRAEMATAARLAREHRSVAEVYVGNEAILRGEASPEDIVRLMREMRVRTRKPVSTGETWDVWLKHPELARTADFVAAHVLPYWEGVPAERAVEVAVERYERLRAAFPGKHVVIAEFGWPSAKFNRGAAKATLLNQAAVVRDFVAEARRRRIDYNIIEAFDQPWKVGEGDVGPYWGVFDAEREAKFSFVGEVVPDPIWHGKAAAGVAFGALLAGAFLFRRRASFLQCAAVALAAQAIGFAVAAAGAVPIETYANAGLVVMWAVSVPLVLLLVATAFDRARELADVALGRAPERLIRPPREPDPSYAPKVSIHVPACGELAEVVVETLESLARLDYPDFEVLAVVNNTSKPELVEPVRAACERLGARFRFVHFPRISGYKAGALNGALAHTADDAEIIACVDADYTVDPAWLRDLVPAFRDPGVALVQAPQEHRDQHRGWLQHAMNAEYSGFFDVGMIERNEDDSIIAHGTMIMVRRSAFERVGRWSEEHICEDTELGLRLFEAGYSAAYTNRRYGSGLLPDTLRAFRRQRDRWAYGAMRIMLAHWRHMLPWSRTLTSAQKYHFASGWLHWVADAVAVALALANLCWVAYMQATGLGEPPTAVLTASTAAAAAVSLFHTLASHALRVRRGVRDMVLASLAGVSLQLTVARAVFSGLVLSNLPFHVTAKGGRATAGWGQFVRGFGPELLLGGALAGAAAATILGNRERVFELDAFGAVLAVQSVPFLVAFGLGLAELATLSLARRRAAGGPPPAEAAASANANC